MFPLKDVTILIDILFAILAMSALPMAISTSQISWSMARQAHVESQPFLIGSKAGGITSIGNFVSFIYRGDGLSLNGLMKIG